MSLAAGVGGRRRQRPGRCPAGLSLSAAARVLSSPLAAQSFQAASTYRKHHHAEFLDC